jgi:glucose/mannose transport system permease protein
MAYAEHWMQNSAIAFRWRTFVLRTGIYLMLLGAAAIFLAPLLVMVMTSFKSTEEIRTGTIFSLPRLL